MERIETYFITSLSIIFRKNLPEQTVTFNAGFHSAHWTIRQSTIQFILALNINM